jgi:hypothetical protein
LSVCFVDSTERRSAGPTDFLEDIHTQLFNKYKLRNKTVTIQNTIKFNKFPPSKVTGVWRYDYAIHRKGRVRFILGMSPRDNLDGLSNAELKSLVLKLLEEMAELRRTVAATSR